MIKQLHIVPDISVCSGGRSLASLRYAEALAKAGADVTLFAASKAAGTSFRPDSHSPRFTLVSDSPGNGHLSGHYKVIDAISSQKSFDLIHLHGCWLPLFISAVFVSLKRKIPFVVSPHGCLEPWALKHKRMKKWIALRSYQGFINRTAAMFFATSNHEVDGLRLIGVSQPVALIPNGVDIGAPPNRPAHAGKRSILFLSRIHPVKGLIDLVEAWAKVQRPNWRIVIAGPDEKGHRSDVETLIRLRGLETDFEFVGLVDGQRKQECFEKANLFVLPSYSENFGISVVEAMANELPVITTTGTPWKDLESYRCGWCVTPGVAGLSAALRSAMATSSDELQLMGKRGRGLVIEKFSWDKIGEKALKAYEWMLGRIQTKPEFVDLVENRASNRSQTQCYVD